MVDWGTLATQAIVSGAIATATVWVAVRLSEKSVKASHVETEISTARRAAGMAIGAAYIASKEAMRLPGRSKETADQRIGATFDALHVLRAEVTAFKFLVGEPILEECPDGSVRAAMGALRAFDERRADLDWSKDKVCEHLERVREQTDNALKAFEGKRRSGEVITRPMLAPA